jgi:hypothetical protein
MIPRVKVMRRKASENCCLRIKAKETKKCRHRDHSDYRTVSPYWVLPVYVELIRAVWADDRDRPLLV